MLARSIVAALALSLLASRADAFVTAPVGGHPGEVDLSLRIGLERGKIEPNEFTGSWQRAEWNLYMVGAGYTHGTIGPFEDVFFRVDSTIYSSPAESTDPDVLVNPESGKISRERCKGRWIESGGICEFHPSDTGWLVTPAVGANLVHKADFSFGVFLQGTIPIGVELSKFVLPRIDYFAGGTQLGVHVTPWFGTTSRVYVGSGAFGGEHTQNAAIAVTTLFAFEAREWLLPWRAGVHVGPYFEGDLTERFDDAYDAAYTAGHPARRDRIRSMKFGLAMLPYARITEHAALTFGYVQKLFGYDAPATQFFTIGVNAAF
jgi:hypothetical protein